MRLNLIATAYLPQGGWGGGNVIANLGTLGCTVVGAASVNQFSITLPRVPKRDELIRIHFSPGPGSLVAPGAGAGMSSITRNADGSGSVVVGMWNVDDPTDEIPFTVDIYEVLPDYGP